MNTSSVSHCRYYMLLAAFVTFIIPLLCFIPSASAATGMSASDAAAIALMAVGTGPVDDSTIEALSTHTQCISMIDTTTAFLSQYLSGRRVWKSVIKDVRFELAFEGHWDSLIHVTGPPQKITIYVDSILGIPIRIECISEGVDPEKWIKYNAERNEAGLRRISEKYVGLPDSLPSISFQQALSAARIGISTVEEMVGLYLLATNVDQPPIAVWDIYYYGVESLSSMKNAHLPEQRRKRLRMRMDAVSGEFIFGGNIPYFP